MLKKDMAKTITSEELRLYITAEVEKALENLKKYEKGVGSASKKISDFAKDLNKFGNTMTIGVTAPLVAVSGYAIKAAADFEKVRTVYGKLLGDAKQGNDFFEKVRALSAKTPLQMGDLNKVAPTLLAVKYSGEEVLVMMKRLGDAAMGDSEKFQRLSAAFAKVKSKGRVELEQLNSIAEMGVPIIDELAKGYGLLGEDQSKVFEMVSKGKVSYQDLEQALVRLTSTGGKFANMMEATSQTTSGKMSTALDNLKIAAAGFGEVALPLVNDLLDKGTSILQSFASLDEGEKKLIMISGAVLALAGPTAKVAAGFINLTQAIKGVGAASGGVKLLGGMLAKMAPLLLNPVGAIAGLTAVLGVGAAVGIGTHVKNQKEEERRERNRIQEGEAFIREEIMKNDPLFYIREAKGNFKEIERLVPGANPFVYNKALDIGSDAALQRFVEVSKETVEIQAKISEKDKNREERLSKIFNSLTKTNSHYKDFEKDGSGLYYGFDGRNYSHITEDGLLKGLRSLAKELSGKIEKLNPEISSDLKDLSKTGDIEDIQEYLKTTLKNKITPLTEDDLQLDEKLKSLKDIFKVFENLEGSKTPELPEYKDLWTKNFASTLESFNAMNFFLEKTLGLSSDTVSILTKEVSFQQQINALVDKKNAIFNKNQSTESTDETKAIDSEIQKLQKEIKDSQKVKKLRNDLASLNSAEKITMENILQEGSAILSIGEKIKNQKDQELAQIKKREEFINKLDAAIEQLYKSLASEPDVDKEKIQKKIDSLESVKKEVKPESEGDDFSGESGITEAALSLSENIIQALIDSIESGDLGEVAKTFKAKMSELTQNLEQDLMDMGLEADEAQYAAGAAKIATSLIAGGMGIADAVEGGKTKKEVAAQSMDMIVGVGAGIASMFGPFGPIVEAVGGMLSSIIQLIIEASDYKSETQRLADETNAPLLKSIEESKKEEEKLANLRNQHIDETLEKQKKAHEEIMALIDARSSAELKNLEEMRKAGVISASEYEKKYAEIVTKAAGEKSEEQKKYEKEKDSMKKFQSYADSQEQKMKELIEGHKKIYKKVYKNSYEEGLLVKGSGKIGIRKGEKADAADAYEKYIQEWKELLAQVQNGEFKTKEELDEAMSKLAKKQIYAAANGADFITREPTLILAGEAGQERVHITPAPKAGSSSHEAQYTIVIQNPIGIQGLTQEVIEAAKLLYRRGL